MHTVDYEDLDETPEEGAGANGHPRPQRRAPGEAAERPAVPVELSRGAAALLAARPPRLGPCFWTGREPRGGPGAQSLRSAPTATGSRR